MPQDKRDQLAWVARNRSRRSSMSHAGSAVERIVTTLEQRGLEPAMAVAEALSPVVDEAFRRHCRITGAVDGRVTIQVDTPALVSVMRRKWLGIVREGLRRVNPRSGGGGIVFEPGRSGVEIPPA